MTFVEASFVDNACGGYKLCSLSYLLLAILMAPGQPAKPPLQVWSKAD